MSLPIRNGYSLLEVILATAILLGSVVVLGELARIGRKHVTSAEQLSAAQLVCEAKINEILAGLSPLENVAETLVGPTNFSPRGELATDTRSEMKASETLEAETWETGPQWLYTVDVQPLDWPGLVALKVTVTEDVENKRPTQFSIIRWVRDPTFQQGESVDGMPVSQQIGYGSQP